MVTVWESKAHQERWAAEQLFPVFAELGLSGIPAGTEFTEYDAEEFYIR
jgi:heme-degrading monooxygenase HmoA